MEPTVVIETIDQSTAVKYLATEKRNRALSIDHVNELLIPEMERDEFRLTNDAITFDDRGELINGKHRLTSVVKSGIPITVIVLRGVPLDSQMCMDRPKRRSLADQLKLHGEKNVVDLASAIGFLHRRETGNQRQTGHGKSPTPKRGLRLLEKHPGIRESVPSSRRIGRELRYSRGLAVFLHYRFSMLDPEDADAFFEALASGADLTEGTPIYVLRKRLVREATSQTQASVHYIHAITIKTWNAWREGRDSIRLRWQIGGSNPEPFPDPF